MCWRPKFSNFFNSFHNRVEFGMIFWRAFGISGVGLNTPNPPLGTPLSKIIIVHSHGLQFAYSVYFIPLACAESDNCLPFSGTSSIPLCYVPFASTLFHQLVFHPSSLHLAIYFLVFLSILLFPNSYIIPFWDSEVCHPRCVGTTTQKFRVLHNTVEHNYISYSSTPGLQLHVSAL